MRIRRENALYDAGRNAACRRARWDVRYHHDIGPIRLNDYAVSLKDSLSKPKCQMSLLLTAQLSPRLEAAIAMAISVDFAWGEPCFVGPEQNIDVWLGEPNL
jgi:hypothetical protein